MTERKKFPEDKSTMEECYQGKWDPPTMRDYCWFLQREDTTVHKRNIKTKRDLPRKTIIIF
jgi:hypothetical protein